MHTKSIWETIEILAKKNYGVLTSTFEQNYPLVEKLIVATKKTMNSKSDISMHMRSVINLIRNSNKDVDKMVKEATKILSSK
jgi:hypothetical protein